MAQTPPTVTLSVPADTAFAEGEGSTTVTVTATLSAARATATVVDLSLAGTARSTDYAVVQLPDITISAGQTKGTADLTLRPVDDGFFERQETVSIGGAAAGVTVNAVDVALADDETAPTLDVSVRRIDRPGYAIIREGESAHLRITVTLVGATFEAKETVSLAPEGTQISAADIDYGTNSPPWSLDIPAGRVSAQMDLRFTVVDDELAENSESADLRASVTVAGTTITARQRQGQHFLWIYASDLSLLFRVLCIPSLAYADDTISCAPGVFNGRTARDYSVTISWDDTTLVSPASKVFTVGNGRTGDLADLAAEFSLQPGAAGRRLSYTVSVSPNDEAERVSPHLPDLHVYPAADANHEFTDLELLQTWEGTVSTGQLAFILGIGQGAPRPVEPVGTSKRVEVVLDSGVVSVPCVDPGQWIRCIYNVQDGDYDFDGRIEVPAGAVKFTRWRDVRDTAVTGSVASPLPAQKMTFEIPRTQIYGGSVAIDLSVSPQTVQEGAGEQALTIIAVSRAGLASSADIVLPLQFTNVSTSNADYSVRGPLSVTIPRGQVEGRTTAVLFTATDDLHREDRLETVRIEGSKGAMMTPFVRGADLKILDAAGIALSVSPARIAEDGAATQVRVTAAWGDAADSTLARDVEVALAWGGTAGAGDYARTGGTTVTIPANARSGTTTVTITPTDDNLLEGDETIVIGGSVAGRPVASAELTLADDETVPAVTLSVDTDAVSESGAAVSVTVSAELDPQVAMANDVTTVTLELGGTATAGTDYSATWSPASRQISIPRESTLGSNTVTLTLTPTDDSVAEGDETVVVQGTATTDMASRNLVVKVATIALEDDDTLGINLSPKTLTVEEGATGTYEVWLGAQPTGDVTVTLSSTDATTATVDENELTFTETTWNTRQTVTLTGQDDDRNNADDRRTASIRHTASGGGYDDLAAVVLPVTVTDDDGAASFSIGDASATEGQAASFTVTRRGATGDAATVAWSTAEDADGDHPASTADYTAQTAAQTLSFAAGETSKTVTVRTTQDTLDEDDETFLVELSSPSTGTSIADGTATGTIIDDDATTAELSIVAPAAVSEGAADATATMSFEVNLSAASGRRVTVDYADAGSGTATSGTDYSLTAGTLAFAAGERSKTISVTVNGDDVDEGNETVTLRLSSPVNARFAAGVTTLDATGTITDDDTRGVTVSAPGAGVSVAEADDSRTSSTRENEASYTVALASEPTGTVTIEIESGDTRVATVSPLSIEFTASDWAAKTVTVTGVSDDVDNANDRRTTRITHTVDAVRTDYEDETAASVPVTVTDDEDTPTVALSLDPASIAESGNGNASTVTAALDRASHAAVTVTVSVPDGAPVTQTGTTLTIAAGATASTGTVTLTAVDNNVDAPHAAVAVSGDADGGGVADPTDVTLTITDDDAAPTGITLTTDTPTIAEDAATKTVKVTATVNGDTTYATDTTVRVTVGANTDSATSNADYAAVSAFDIEIDAGKMSGEQTFSLDPTDDAIDEDTESISVSGASGALTVTGASIALTDDDTRGVTVSSTSLTVAEVDTSGTPAEEHKATYTVVLTSEPTDDVTINISVPDGAPFTVSATRLDFTPSTWSTAQTVTVTASNDNIDNTGDARSARITHTVVAGDSDYEDETAANVEVTVNDDDGPPVISIDAPRISEGASGAAATLRFTVSLDAASGKEVTVAYAEIAGGTATQGTDYQALTSGTLTFDAGDTTTHIDITVTGDGIDEDNETVKVRLSSPSNATLSGGNANLDATGTITDDDTKGVTVSAASAGLTVRETDDGGTPATENVATYTVVLTSEPTGDVVIDVSVPEGAPFTASPSRLTFTASGAGIWSTAQRVTVTAVDDNVDNTGNERSASITHSLTVGRSDYQGVSVPDVTVTVTDDDAAPTALTLTVDADTETDNVQTSVSEGGGAKTVRVTATLDGSTTFATDKTVTVEVGKSGDSAAEGADYARVGTQSITIKAGASSGHVDFTLTPTDDAVDEANETISLDGTLAGVTVTDAVITLTDDDDAPGGIALSVDTDSVMAGGQTEVGEAAGATTVTVTATVTGSTTYSGAQTVAVSVSGDTATVTDDFAAVTGFTITIPAGTASARGTFTLTPVADAIDEDDETVDVTGTVSGDGAPAVTGATITIKDDDTKGVTVSAASAGLTVRETDDGGTPATENVATYTVVLTSEPTGDVVIDVSVPEGAPFTASPSRLTFTASGAGIWSTAQRVTVTAVDDNVDNTGNERSASITHSLTVGRSDYQGVSVPDVAVTVTDDDGAPGGIALSVDTDSVMAGGQTNVGEAAGATTVRVTATVTGDTTYGVAQTVAVSVSGGTATVTDDFAAVTGFNITIPAGATARTGMFTLTPVNDLVHEGNESINVTGAVSGVGAPTVSAAAVTIADDDAAPTGLTLTVDADTGTVAVQSSLSEGGGAKTVRVTATLDGSTTFAVDKTVTVEVGKSGDSAAEGAGGDYGTVARQDITIKAGASSGHADFTLTPVNDLLFEGDETISLDGTLAGVTVTDATIMLTDDETLPAVTLLVDPDAVSESGGTRTVTVSAVLDPDVAMANDTTTVTLSLGGTATGGTDYTSSWSPSTPVITFPVGETEGANTVTLTLTPTDDSSAEEDETVVVQGTATTQSRSLVVKIAVITLEDDDAPGVNLSPRSLTVTEGATTTYDVWLGTQPSGDVTVTLSGLDTTMATADRGSLIFRRATWNTRQQVMVSGEEDDLDNAGDKRVTSIRHSAAGGGYGNVDDAVLNVTVADNDDAPSFSIGDASAAEGDAVTFTVNRAGAKGAAATVSWQTADDTDGSHPASTADYTAQATAQVLNFAAGDTSKTLTVQTTEDMLHEENETFLVKLSAPSADASIDDGTATGTITDDDSAPTTATLTVDADTGTSNVQNSLAEDGGAKTVRVTATLGGSVTFTAAKTVTVEVGNSDDSATEGTDYTIVGTQTVTIKAGASSGHVDFTLTPTQDQLAEGGETISFKGTAAGLTVADAAITLTDDDSAPTTATLAVDADTGTQNAQNSLAEDGGAKTVRVTATLGGSVTFTEDKTVTVEVGNSGDTATEGTDYATVGMQTVTIKAGASSGHVDFVLTPTQDQLAEGGETISFKGTAAGLTVADAMITLTDDDSAPTTATLTVDADTGTGNMQNSLAEDGGAKTVRVTATLDGSTTFAVDKTVTVEVGNSDDSATEGTDYTIVGTQTVTIKAGASSGHVDFTLTPTQDQLAEGGETISFKGTADGVTVVDATITLTDDDSAPTTATLTVDADTGTGNVQNSLAEGGGAKTVRVMVTLDGSTTFAVDKTVTVEVGNSGDTATEGTDYTIVGTQTVTIKAGASSGHVDFTLTPTADPLHEGDETISVEGALSGVSVTGATITITDDDAARMITVLLSASDYEVFEGESLTVKVNLSESRAADTVIALDPATQTGQTATRGVDYDGSMRTVTILAGETSGTARISTTADDREDPNETFTVAIQESGLSSEVILGEPHTAVVTIRERVTGVTPPATATVEYKGSDSRITLTVPADLQGNGIDVAFRYGTDKGTARSGGFQCGDDDDADLINREVVGSGTPGEVINRPTLRRMMDLDADTVDLEIDLCPGSRGKTFDVIWDTTLYLGNPDRGYPGTRSAPFDAAAAHCSSASLCRTRVTIEGGDAVEACVSHSLRETVEFHAGEAHHGDAHVDRWKTVLAAFGDDNGYTPMTAAQAQQNANQFQASRWNPVVTALQCMEAAPEAEDASVLAGPEVTVLGGGDIAEGAAAVLTVQANPAPASDLTVALAIADDIASDFLAENDEGLKTVTIKAGESSAAYTLTTVDDNVEEADGSVSAMVEAGTGYRVGTPSKVVVTVSDDDDPAPVAPVVTIAGGAGVTEGAPASFTVTANPAPAAPLTVALTIDQSGDYAAAGETGVREVVVLTGGSTAFEVATVNDNADEPDGLISATLAAGSGYAVAASPDDTASVTVADDDEAAGVPSFSVDDAEGKEHEWRLSYTIRLSPASDRTVSVWVHTRESDPVSARDGEDYVGMGWGTRIVFPPGTTERELGITLINDSHDEGSETFEVELLDPKGGAKIADGVGVMTIVNDDPMPAAFLSRFGRAAAEQALDGIAGRIAAPREAGAQGTLAGQALSFGSSPEADGAVNGFGAANDIAPVGGVSHGVSLAQSDVARAFGASADRFGEGHGPDHAHGLGESRTMTGVEVLLGSSFTATGEQDRSGGSLAFWGRAAQSGFDGREGTFSLDGETTTAMLGADYARGNWLVGLVLMQSSGDGGYADSGSGPQHCPDDMDGSLCNGAVQESDGDVEASLTAAVAYAAIQPSERLRLWGAAGHGTGEVTLKPEVGGSLKSDISWTMAAAGARSDLLPPPTEGSGLALALTADALWARTSSEKTHELAASDSDATRLRVGLEGSYAIATAGGGSVTPRVELGARHDGGNAETGSGVELGGGIAWTDPAIGLSLDLSGRTLIAHGNDDLEDQGFAASLVFDPKPGTERGLSLTLRQDWGGSAQGGLDALFAADPLSDRGGFGEAESRWQAEAAYGLPAFGGRFTGSPHVGLGLSTAARNYSVGWRLAPEAATAPDVSFGLKATRRESDSVQLEHTVGFELTARW